MKIKIADHEDWQNTTLPLMGNWSNVSVGTRQLLVTGHDENDTRHGISLFNSSPSEYHTQSWSFSALALSAQICHGVHHCTAF